MAKSSNLIGGFNFETGESKPLRKRKTSKPLYSEHQEQVFFFDWLRDHERQYPILQRVFAIPNGGHRHKAVAAAMSREGCRSGVLDICLPVARHNFVALWIEMKAGKNRLSPAQKEWKAFLESENHLVCVCWKAEDAVQCVVEYLGLRPGEYTPLIIRR